MINWIGSPRVITFLACPAFERYLGLGHVAVQCSGFLD